MNGINFDEELYKKFFEVVGSPEEGAVATRRISQAKAAQALGYSSGVISAYKSKTYSGDVKTLEKRIEEWLKREARRLDKISVPVAHTSAMEKVKRAITIAQDEGDIAVVIGESGTGKTTALKQYVKESHSALMIEVDPGFSQITLMAEIAKVLGVDHKGGANAVTERIIETLTGRDAVLIIDEADYLSDSSLELLRRIINDKSRTGVVLVGLPRLEFKIRNLRNDHQKTESVFKSGKKAKFLYHGTRNANWLSVLQNGLKIRPQGVQTTGSMFGDAIYFANKAQKSLGYTSMKGSYWASGSDTIAYLAIFEVNTGKEWSVLKNQKYQSWMSSIDAARVKREGCDTVYAKKGADLKNDEYMIYEASRCTIRYLIEIKK